MGAKSGQVGGLLLTPARYYGFTQIAMFGICIFLGSFNSWFSTIDQMLMGMASQRSMIDGEGKRSSGGLGKH
jgi:hypothetical protein